MFKKIVLATVLVMGMASSAEASSFFISFAPAPAYYEPVYQPVPYGYYGQPVSYVAYGRPVPRFYGHRERFYGHPRWENHERHDGPRGGDRHW